MNKILVFGHKNPDTDAVCAAISMSNLKNNLGFKTEPRVLGDINDETKYVLKYLNIKCPKYLNDVKLQIKNINYRKNFFIEDTKSLLDALNYMDNKNISSLPVVNYNKKFCKLLASKDILRDIISNSFLSTSYTNIINTLNGESILKFDDEISGTLGKEIVVTNDIKDIKSNIKLIVTNNIVNKKILNMATKYKINIIKTDLNTYDVSHKILYSNYIKNIGYKNSLVTVNINDYVSEILKLTKKTKYSYYPVIDNDRNSLGLLKAADLYDKKPKKVILVDHNEYNQSADGIEEAEIIEIIDHHRLGSNTNYPINVRNMPVGATNTIIYNLYKEHNIKIDKTMAGVMLAGILSDTLILTSPTTTDMDKEAVIALSKIGDIDYKEFGMNIIKSGSDYSLKTIDEIIYKDLKIFDNEGEKIVISQVLTTDIEQMLKKKNKIIDRLNEISKQNDYDVFTIFITDIFNSGSYILYSDNSYEYIKNSFNKKLKQGVFLENVISRKKQILPAIIGGL